MTADDVLDVESADEEQQDILASTKDDWSSNEDNRAENDRADDWRRLISVTNELSSRFNSKVGNIYPTILFHELNMVDHVLLLFLK